MLAATGDLAGVRVLVTAGGTREPIDAVRVISNRSSGKQGYAVAEVAARRGAAVTLVTTIGRPAPPGVEIVSVQTAAEMQEAVLARAADMDVIVQAAAVADFRPKAPPDRKLKKDDGIPEIVLEPTHDFSVDLGARQAARPGARRVRGRDRRPGRATRRGSSRRSGSTSSSPTTSPSPMPASKSTRTAPSCSTPRVASNRCRCNRRSTSPR